MNRPTMGMVRPAIASGLLASLARHPELIGRAFAAPQRTLDEMREQAEGFKAANQALQEAADAANRDLTADELGQIENNIAEYQRVQGQIQARESIAAMATPAGAAPGSARRTAPEPRAAGGGARPVPAAARVGAGRAGFTSFGEFAMAVRLHALGQQDPRIMQAATTIGTEGTGADGGFAVPPDFRTTIWEKVMAEENLLARCAPLVTGANSITIPKDETTPWQTSGGIQVYWEAEAATVTQSKPDLSMSQIRLAKLMALVPVSDELLEDAPGLESWLRAKAPQKMAAKINTAIISGTGVGQPLGILNAPATVVVAKEVSQAAATILFANIQKMWAHMYAPSRRNAIWIINQDTEPQLNGMAFAPASSVPIPVYLPQNGLSVEPYATLMGRPVIPLEAAQTIGTEGDIILADLEQYWALTKGNDIRTDVSMHLYFDQGLQAFRFTFRVNGQPAWGKSITPQYGSTQRSCFVALATRS